MPDFKYPLDLFQLILPPVSTGLLFGGLILYLYLTIQYKSSLFRSITILGFVSFVFVLCESLLLFYGSWLGNIEIGRQFHRLEHIAAAFFLFSFPYLLVHLLELNKTWKRINFIISITGLITAVFITVMAFVKPEMFISMIQERSTALTTAGDYARGSEGILYVLRDLFVGVFILYGIICITADLIWHKRFGELLPTVAGLLLAIYGALVDIIYIYTRIHLDIFPDIQYSRLTMGLTFMVLLLMSGITRKFIQFSKNLENANKKITLSEKKYRLLTEGTEDCIFTLNKHFYFINANKQTFRKLNLKEKNLGKTHFLDMLYLEKDHKDFFRDFVKDKLKTLIETRERVNLRAKLKSYFSKEPDSYNISFEYLETENEAEIICKASRLQEDLILKYIQAESGKYVIDNYLLTIEEICSRLVNYLPKFLDNDSIGQIRLGIREILINAVEHGNLDISYEEKTHALAGNNYFIFIRNRQEDQKYKDKKIVVEYSLSPSKVIYRITDSGDGFDVANTFRAAKKNTESLNLHGRGIIMANSIFDKISYNTKGNRVTLVKEFNK
jgi:hypothetical protein